MQRELKQLQKLKKYSKAIRLAAESWKNDYEILVSTILSARTRDEKTIPVAEKLFKKYPTIEKLAKANILEIKKIIRPINFYKNKSKNIINCSKDLMEKHRGKIPYDFEKLIKFPGVGRKTANVFLAELGGDHIGTDTHVMYCSQRLGWTKNKKPEKIEKDLEKLFPKKYWGKINGILVRFGKTHTSPKKKDKLLDEIKRIK